MKNGINNDLIIVLLIHFNKIITQSKLYFFYELSINFLALYLDPSLIPNINYSSIQDKVVIPSTSFSKGSKLLSIPKSRKIMQSKFHQTKPFKQQYTKLNKISHQINSQNDAVLLHQKNKVKGNCQKYLGKCKVVHHVVMNFTEHGQLYRTFQKQQLSIIDQLDVEMKIKIKKLNMELRQRNQKKQIEKQTQQKKMPKEERSPQNKKQYNKIRMNINTTSSIEQQYSIFLI